MRWQELCVLFSKLQNMNTLKIVLGIAATAAGAYALNRVRKNESQKQLAKNANSDHTSESEDREHIKPQNHFITDPITATKHSDTFSQNYQAANKNVQFHQRGVRHR